jgi:glutathione-independent formaldehyde dehydrogenase
MPNPKIEAPNDTVVGMTATNICGPDLHIHEGRTPAEPGFIFGHENQGIVEEGKARGHQTGHRAGAG